MELPPSLARRIALFRINGTIPEHVDPLFRSVSWQALMDGLGVRPRAHHPAIDRVAAGEVNRELGAMAEALAGFVATLPAHEAFLARHRSEEHTSELQSLMRISYAVFCLKKKNKKKHKSYSTRLNRTNN